MKRYFLWMLIALAASACTLGTAQEARELQLIATQNGVPAPDDSDGAAGDGVAPDGVPTVETSPSPINLIPLASPSAAIPAGGVGDCNRLRVDVGGDAGNTLRLRQQPTNDAEIILLIPNSSIVTRVTGSNEIAADGYAWLNIQYTDPNGIIATGWAARNAMQDRATLQAAC